MSLDEIMRPSREMHQAADVLEHLQAGITLTPEMSAALVQWLHASAKMTEIGCKMAGRVSLSLEQLKAATFARAVLGFPPLPEDEG